MTKRRDVVLSREAQADLDSINDYIAERAGKTVADGYTDRIVAHCERLDQMPERGRLLADGNRRLEFERRCTIVYSVQPRQVVIQGFYYAGRLLPHERNPA